jgi:hypothetical protein
LHDAGHKPIQFVEIDCYSRIGHRFSSRQGFVGIQKSPPADSPAGLGVSDLSDRLFQVMAVRRHTSPVMMVVTVMAVVLHLDSHYGQIRRAVNKIEQIPEIRHSGLMYLNPGLGLRRLLHQLNNPLVEPVAQFEPLRGARHVTHLGANT